MALKMAMTNVRLRFLLPGKIQIQNNRMQSVRRTVASTKKWLACSPFQSFNDCPCGDQAPQKNPEIPKLIYRHFIHRRKKKGARMHPEKWIARLTTFEHTETN
jgi:hypothetical protein